MAPYRYDTPSESPLIGSIGDIIQRQGQLQGQSALELAKLTAQQQAASGANWGHAVETLGQLPGQVMEQNRRNQLADTDVALKGVQMKAAQATLDDVTRTRNYKIAAGLAIQKSIQNNRDPETGEIDPQKVFNEVAPQFPDEADNFVKSFANAASAHQGMVKSKQDAANQEQIYLGRLAQSADSAADFMDSLATAQHTGNISQATIDRVGKDMASTNAWDPLKARYVKTADQLAPTVDVKKGETRYGAISQTPLFENAPDITNEWELVRDAADPTSKTQAQSIAALKLYQDAKATPANAELKAGKVGGKGPVVMAVWDPKKQTLTYRGQDVTNNFTAPTDPAEVAAGAAARQLAAANRTETRQNLVKAKGDIDKASDTFIKARSAADEIRAIVSEAKTGNNIAGAFQKFQTAASAVRAAGFNRFNTTEMGVPANAGSALDNLEGRVGQYLQGGSASMVPSLQKDMLGFADMLEKAAFHVYTSTHDKTNQLYETKIPYLFDAPSAPAPEGSELDPAIAARLKKH